MGADAATPSAQMPAQAPVMNAGAERATRGSRVTARDAHEAELLRDRPPHFGTL